MVTAGYAVEIIFGAAGLIPETRNAKVVETSITFNYDTVLNIIFLIVAAALVWRFLRTGGREMFRMMSPGRG
jgi:hypothetical protein